MLSLCKAQALFITDSITVKAMEYRENMAEQLPKLKIGGRNDYTEMWGSIFFLEDTRPGLYLIYDELICILSKIRTAGLYVTVKHILRTFSV